MASERTSDRKDAPVHPPQVGQQQLPLQGRGPAAQELHRLRGLDGGAEGRREGQAGLFRRRGHPAIEPAESAAARAVVNCAGLQADAVRELTKVPAIRIVPTAGDYLVLDSTVSGFLRHIIFHEPEDRGKGLTLVPTVDGNLLVGPAERSWDGTPDCAVSREGLETLCRLCAQAVPAGIPVSTPAAGASGGRGTWKTGRGTS